MPRLAPLKNSPRVAPGAAGRPEAGGEDENQLAPAAGFSPLALDVEGAQPSKTSFVMRASPEEPAEPVVAALSPDGGGEVTVDDVIKCAKDHAERELRKVHEDRRVSAILRAGHADGSIDAQLRKQLEMLDEDGDGEISNEEVIHFCKNFAEQQLSLAEEHEAREAAERDARQLRTRLVGRPRGNLPFFWRRVARVVSPVGRSCCLRPASRLVARRAPRVFETRRGARARHRRGRAFDRRTL